MHYFTDVIKKYAVFNGRASRKEYWMFVLVYFIISLILGVILKIFDKVLKVDLTWISKIFVLAISLPSLGVAVRRLHDTNKSGWWILANLIIGAIFTVSILFVFFGGMLLMIPAGIAYCVITLFILVFLIRKGQVGPNKYGPDPREVATPAPGIPTGDPTAQSDQGPQITPTQTP